MFKNLFTKLIMLSAMFCILNITPVYADILINKKMDKPFANPMEYEEFVKEVLYNSNFKTINKDDKKSTYDIEFFNDNFTIIYRNKNEINYYRGDFAILNNELRMKITETRKSDKYGFYAVNHHDEQPFNLKNNLSIFDDRINLLLSSTEFPDLNTTLYIENDFVDITEDDLKQLKSFDNELKNVFLVRKVWQFENPNSDNKFTHFTFKDANNIQLVDDDNKEEISIVEGTYLFDKGNLKIMPKTITTINKTSNTISTINFENVFNNRTNTKYDYYKDLNFEISYLEKSNGYFISKNGITHKIFPTDIELFDLSLKRVSSIDISDMFVGNTMKIGSDTNSLITKFEKNNDDFTGRLITEDRESVLSGKYEIKNDLIEFTFIEEGYFVNVDMDTVYYDMTNSLKTYSLTIAINKFKNNTIANFINSDYANIKIAKDEKLFLQANILDDYSFRASPKKVATTNISTFLNEKSFSFNENDKVNGAKYNLVFKENSQVEILIERNNALEVIKGAYKIEDGRVIISNNNKLYNYGDYSNYQQGNLKTENKNWFMTMYLYVKFDGNNLYFAIDDGSQISNVSPITNRNIIENGAFYKSIKLTDEYPLPETNVATITEIQNYLAESKFNVRYSKDSYEEIVLGKDRTITISSTNKNNKATIQEGTYTIKSGKISVIITKKYIQDNKENLLKTPEKFDLQIFKDKIYETYYIRLNDGIYLNLIKL